ncbi:META domain-containing protein [Brevibacterium atlanticum]|uniref:hypothetical protein n=1 Tax=Brevibacterium atlanticum TaxID=2697563 RepID=UPI001420B680|nr:hypothetical protein [Brevibacterium atlanticum]
MTHDAIGRWVAEDNDRAFLDFQEDGTLRGNDGANALVTSWTDDSEGVTIKSSLTTLRAAPNMIKWIPKARRVEPDGDRLHVFDSAENHLGDLLRQPPAGSGTDEGR